MLSDAQSQRPGSRQAIVGTPASASSPAHRLTDSPTHVPLTVPELIETVLTNIKNQFYLDQPRRNFKRDQTALMKAVARFGYQCNANDWQFTAEEIQKSILDLLQQIKRTESDINYLPVYLQSAIDKHLRQKAEEYNAAAKARRSPLSIIPKFQSNLSNLKPAPVVTDVEVLAKVYNDLAAKRRAKTKQSRARKQSVEQQTALL